MTITERLNQIREREKKATPGPWDHSEYSSAISKNGERIATMDGGYFNGAADQELDRDFITHARTDIPFLLARIDELTKELFLINVACTSVLDQNATSTGLNAAEVKKRIRAVLKDREEV